MSALVLMQRAAAGFAVALLAGGCVMIPDYQQPETAQLPQNLPDGPAYPELSEDTPDRPASAVGWRDFFTDERLESLIAKALENNPDARMAALEVERVRAQYQLQSAALLPEIDAEGSYTRQKNPAGFGGGGASGGSGSGGPSGGAGSGQGGGTFDYYRAGVGVTAYELDLFGRVRSLKQSALESYLASVQAGRSVQVALVASVANAYLQWVADDALLRLSQQTLAAREQSLALIRKRVDAGIASQLDLRQAETARETARADLARFRRRRAQSRNALVALVGSDLPDEPAAGNALSERMTIDLPTPGLSSQLLLRRPDVLAAEHQLKAANADIGAARAAFFPRISLTGSYGSISPELDGLFESGTTIWSFTPQISIPIFDGGRNEANLDVATVSKRIEVAEYRKAIRTAFREVADALAARGTLDEGLAARRERVEAARASFELSRKRYRKGVASYLPVLDAQRALYDAQQALINGELAGLANQVTLYKVLGGGWREQTRSRSEGDARDETGDTARPGNVDEDHKGKAISSG